MLRFRSQQPATKSRTISGGVDEKCNTRAAMDASSPAVRGAALAVALMVVGLVLLPGSPSDQGRSLLSSGSPSFRPLEQLELFLEENKDTPGARFVGLLREHLHVRDGAEAERIVACKRNANLPLCYGGWKNYVKAGGNKAADPKKTRLVLYEDDEEESAYTIDRYKNSKHNIPSLGTSTACLPLMLAGYSASQDTSNLVLELGPFAGLSSKCIAMGMRKNNHNHSPFYIYDTFEGTPNYKAITNRAGWLRKEHPEFNKEHPNFQFLWEEAVKPVYPEAKPVAGWIDKNSLNPQKLGGNNHQVSLISIDSAKDGKQLMDQTAGLESFKKGTIIFLMDYEYVTETVKQTYGCLREHHILPVYASWQMEHWAFVVTEDFSLQDAWLGKCFASIAADLDNSISRMEAFLDADLAYLEGLSETAGSPKLKKMKEIVRGTLVKSLRKKPNQYGKLAKLYGPSPAAVTV